MPKALIAGRGGSGKSTVTALLAHALASKERVVVVDADESNLALGAMLGIEDPEGSIMDFLGGKQTVREKLRSTMRDSGEKKLPFFDDLLKIDEIPPRFVGADENVSWVRIGKVEHSMEGCACPMGFVARSFLKAIYTNPREWVLVDTEAGVEHFGRGVLEGVDIVLVIVEPSREALITARRARQLAEEAGKKCVAVLNKVRDEKNILTEQLREHGIPILGAMPYGNDVAMLNLKGDRLSAEASVFPEVGKIAEALRKMQLGAWDPVA